MQHPVQTISFDTPMGWWKLSTLEPPADLANTVESIWAVRGRAAFRREQILPTGKVELMFNLGGDYRVVDRENGFGGRTFRAAWIVGLQESPVTIEPTFDPMSADAEHLALTLTPYGAQRFFGLPMSELRGQVWELEVLLNRMAGEMHERLLEASGLENRFQILIDWVRAVLNAQGDQYDNQVRYAHAQLQASRGQLRIESLCKDLGVSRSWLARRFKHQVGMSPKRFARVLKFQHVIERIEAFAEVDWSGIALDCGYFDQAHFIRDFKALASHTPAQYLRQRAPGGGSIVIE